jgi:predicted metal-binding protein
MLRDGYTYRKSKKRFSNQTNQKKKKTIFISNLCQKITDIVTQKLKKKKEQIFRENIYRHHVKINQIACLIITFHLRHRSIIYCVLNYFANC